jgi:hypothetical protein
MRRMTFATLLAALLLLTMGMGGVLAAPVNNPHAEQITVICNGDEIDVWVARGNPAFVVGSTQRLIPHEFHIEWVVMVDSEEEPLFEETHPIGQGKKKGLQDRLITCEFVIDLVLLVGDLSPEEQALLAEYDFGPDDIVNIKGYSTVRVMPTPAR